MPENDAPDVVPAWANQMLILLWLLLFGGRWLLAPVLQYAGLLAAAQLDVLDSAVLLKLYLILLVLTSVVAALRAVRSAQSGAKPKRSASRHGAPQAGAPATVAPAVGDESLD